MSVFSLGTNVANGSYGPSVAWPGGDAMFILWGAEGQPQISLDDSSWASPKGSTLNADAAKTYLYGLPDACYLRMRSLGDGASGVVAKCWRDAQPGSYQLGGRDRNTAYQGGRKVLCEGLTTGGSDPVVWDGGDAALWVTGTKGAGTSLLLQVRHNESGDWVNAVPGGDDNYFNFPAAGLPMVRDVILAAEVQYRILLLDPSDTTVNAYLYPASPITFRKIDDNLDASSEGTFLRTMSGG